MATIARSVGDRSLRSLIDLDRGLVSREIYVNEDIYRQEMEQVYARAWLFIGHESLVPGTGRLLPIADGRGDRDLGPRPQGQAARVPQHLQGTAG